MKKAYTVSGEQAPGMLVSSDWLAAKLNDPGVAILHVGTEKDYAAGHIAGARLVTLADISVKSESGLVLELPPVEALVKAFAKLGVSDTSRVIVYAGNDSAQSATRVWFTLDYLGLGHRASLLDGGLKAWQAEGRATSTETPAAATGTFTAMPRPELVVDAAWIQAHRTDASVQLIDARTDEFYSGASKGMMPRAGHIPGAKSVPFPTMFDDARKMKPAESLRAMLPAKPLTVTYCHIGQQATVLYFVARYLGMDARLYDGSFQDWSNRADLPVE